MLNARGNLDVSCCSFRPKRGQMINENTGVTVKVERVVPTVLGLDVLWPLPPLPASHRPHEPLGFSSDATEWKEHTVWQSESSKQECVLSVYHMGLWD